MGNVRDYHLFFPQFAHRMRSMALGESIDLRGTEFVVVEAVIRDLITTQWGFDTRSAALFPGDGFAYAHVHSPDQCGKLAEEVPQLDIADMTSLFADNSLNWASYTDSEPYVQRLQQQIDDLGVRVIGPTHGLPICEPAIIVPQVLQGIRSAGLQLGGHVAQ